MVSGPGGALGAASRTPLGRGLGPSAHGPPRCLPWCITGRRESTVVPSSGGLLAGCTDPVTTAPSPAHLTSFPLSQPPWLSRLYPENILRAVTGAAPPRDKGG